MSGNDACDKCPTVPFRHAPHARMVTPAKPPGGGNTPCTNCGLHCCTPPFCCYGLGCTSHQLDQIREMLGIERGVDVVEALGAYLRSLEAVQVRLHETLPSTFFAGLPLLERVKKIVSAWQHAVIINGQLQAEIDTHEAEHFGRNPLH